MSYYKIKGMTIDPKKEKIFVTAACNNVSPLYYFRSEVLFKENTPFRKKVERVGRDLFGGEFQFLPSVKNRARKCYEACVAEMGNWRAYDWDFGDKDGARRCNEAGERFGALFADKVAAEFGFEYSD